MKNKLIIISILSCLALSCKQNSDTLYSKNSGDLETYFLDERVLALIENESARSKFKEGCILSSKNNHEKANALFTKANEIEPNNVLILNAIGLELSFLKELDLSSEYFKKSLKVDSTVSETYLNFGVLLGKNKQYTEAIDQYKKGLKFEKVKSQKGYFHYNIANAYYKLNNQTEAMKYIEMASKLVIDPRAMQDIKELKFVLEN